MIETVKAILGFVVIAAISAAVGVGAVWGYNSIFNGESPMVEQGDYTAIYEQAGSDVVMFGTSTCPYCAQARDLLAELDITYYEYQLDDVEASKAKELFVRLESQVVPVLLIGSTRINGFSEENIRSALGEIVQEVAHAF